MSNVVAYLSENLVLHLKVCAFFVHIFQIKIMQKDFKFYQIQDIQPSENKVFQFWIKCNVLLVLQ